MIYPAWRYHREHEPKLIYSAEEESPAWEDSPAKVGRVPYEANGRMEFAKVPSEEHAVAPVVELKKPGRPKKEKA
jgi:hypothetical protein